MDELLQSRSEKLNNSIDMNEFDKRQLILMQSKIYYFKSHRLHISSLINDLEALLNILEEKDLEWDSLVRGYWWDLEQVYAVALDNDQSEFTVEDNNIINEAINNIEKIVKEKLEKSDHLNENSDEI